MAIKKQETNESQIGLTLFSKKRYIKTNDDELRFLNSPTFNSMGSTPSTDATNIIDDEQEVTLESKKKKPRLGSWWDGVEPFDELSNMLKGLPEAKEDNSVASIADSCFSSTDLNEKKNDDDLKSFSSTDINEEKTKKKNDDDENVDESTPINKGYGHVSLEDLGVSVEHLKGIPWEAFDPTWEIRSMANDPWLGGYIEDLVSPQNNSHT